MSLEISSGERVGVVGRTGAGKSTLAMALFRVVEPCKGRWGAVVECDELLLLFLR